MKTVRLNIQLWLISYRIRDLEITWRWWLYEASFTASFKRQADVSEQTKEGSHLATNVAQTVHQVVQMSVVALGAILVSDGQFGFGAIIACTILSGKALAPFAQFSQILVRLNQIGVSYRALADLMAQPIEHPPEYFFLPRNKIDGAIEFKDVSFTYPSQQEPVLNNVSLELNLGKG